MEKKNTKSSRAGIPEDKHPTVVDNNASEEEASIEYVGVPLEGHEDIVNFVPVPRQQEYMEVPIEGREDVVNLEPVPQEPIFAQPVGFDADEDAVDDSVENQQKHAFVKKLMDDRH